jgi:sugar O-acyltransferase (sialic acid O-acetyltransferase NeuD family)
MRSKLVIIGAGGHGKVVADIALKMNKWESISFLDDNKSIKSLSGFDVIGTIGDALNYKDEADFFVAIGNNAKREALLKEFFDKGFSIVSLVHPNCILGSDVTIEVGTVIMAGVVVNSSTHIGKGCILNTQCNIDHDNIIEDYVHISPGVNLAGTVFIGSHSWIGIGSTVSNNVKIVSCCIIGAGSLVLKDITVPGTYVGAPVQRVN